MASPDTPLLLRVGRSVGRTLYRVNPDGSEDLVGVMDTRQLAEQVAAAVNGQSGPPATCDNPWPAVGVPNGG